MACERDDITEIGRSAREIGRVEGAVSGSTDPTPIPERTAFAMDFLTPRLAICFCKSDFALAGPVLNLVRNTSCGGEQCYDLPEQIDHDQLSRVSDGTVGIL